jgi:hypothetical protein
MGNKKCEKVFKARHAKKSVICGGLLDSKGNCPKCAQSKIDALKIPKHERPPFF